MLDAVNEVTAAGAEVISQSAGESDIASVLEQVDALVAVGESDRAREALMGALARFGPRVELLLRQARMEVDSDHYQRADACFQQATGLDPANPAVVGDYADFLVGFGMERQAIRILTSFLKEAGADPRVRTALGLTYQGAGWRALAVDAYGNPNDLESDAKRARRWCWWRSGGPLVFVRRRVRAVEEESRHTWFSWAENLTILDNLDQPKGFSAALVRGEVDGYLWRRALAWTRWQAFRKWMQHRGRLLIGAVTLLGVFGVLSAARPNASVGVTVPRQS